MNTLIIKPSSLGDIVHGLQVAQSIREQVPDCTISWVAAEHFAPMVRCCPTVDRVIIFQRRGGVKAFYTLMKTLREQPYDYVLDLQGLARSGLMTWLTRSKRKLGRADARELAGFTYHTCAPLPPMGRDAHAIEILLQFLPLMGLQAELRGILHFHTQPIPELETRLAQQPYVLMFPTSRHASKVWPTFESLTELILQRLPQIAVVWGSDVILRDPSFCPHPRFFNRTGKTTLEGLLWLISQAGLVAANDSGPMHLAAALQKPVVALFGVTSFERFGPYPLDKPTHTILQAPNGNLAGLSVETVYQTICRALGRPCFLL